MSCQPIKLKDGTVVLGYMRPGAKVTERDRKELEQFARYLRDRQAEEQRKRNQLAK